MRSMLMGNSSRHIRVGQRQVGQAWGDAEMGSQGKGLGEGTNLSSIAPCPSGPLRHVWGKAAGGRMGRGTYHIQGLPVGVGEGARGGKKT